MDVNIDAVRTSKDDYETLAAATASMEIAGSLRASQGGHGAGFDRSTTGRGTPHPMSQAYQQQQQQKQQRQRQQQQQQQQHEPFYQNTNSDELQYERKEAQMYQNVEEAQRTQHPRPDLAQVRTGHSTMRACANGTTPMRHMATKMLTGSSHVPCLSLPPSLPASPFACCLSLFRCHFPPILLFPCL